VETASVYELVGYTASALIVLSLLMSSVLKLRVINLLGAIVFTAYGVLIGSVPVVLTNAAIVLIDIYYLVVLLRHRSADAYFEVVSTSVDAPVLRRFIERHADDIRGFQPTFEGIRDDHLAWFVLHDAVPVGVVLGRPSSATSDATGSTLHLDVDYVTYPHRDFTPGTVLFGGSGVFHARAITEVTSAAGSRTHQRYLRRMGFTERGELLTRSV
jgi:hypothetical protein